ncbi:MAG: TraB/GumN family protein [Sphingomonas sp.]
MPKLPVPQALRSIKAVGWPVAVAWLMIGGTLAADRGPHLPYPPLPIDARIAPRDTAAANARAAEARSLAEDEAVGGLRQDYAPRPAIWRIGARGSAIYLFGTIHVLPPGFQWRTPLLDAIVRRSRGLIVESVGDDDDAARLIDQAPLGRTLPPLRQRVSPDHRKTLARFVDGLPPDAAALLDTLPTWVAAVAIGYTRDVRAGDLPGPGADDWLTEQFRARGRPVIAIDHTQEVLRAVDAVPEEEQRRLLDAALDAPDRTAAQRRAPLDAWARGDVSPDAALARELNAIRATPAFAKPLMIDRNRAWAAELQRRQHRRGVYLFAAGIGHFIGKGSVIEHLRTRGIRVVRVQ